MCLIIVQTETSRYLVRRSTSREEVAVVVTMNRHVEDVGVVVERLLSSVAMVNILKFDSATDIKLFFLQLAPLSLQ